MLGGTFDPIHYAHLAIAEHAREELDLASVAFLPAATPPHKRDMPVTAAEHRVAMVQLAIADNPWFRLSRLELDRPGPSYLVETLERLATERGEGGEHVFILSAEALAEMPRWRDPARILELSTVAVVPRRGYPVPSRAWLQEHFPGQKDRLVFLKGPELGHSASEIRRLVGEGRSIRYLVPPDVEAYIHRHGLYRRGQEGSRSAGGRDRSDEVELGRGRDDEGWTTRSTARAASADQ